MKVAEMIENKSDMGPEDNPPLVYVTATSTTTNSNDHRTREECQVEWSCPRCTLLNPARKLYCIACFHRHPDLTPRLSEDEEQYEVDSEDDDFADPEYPPLANVDTTREILVQPMEDFRDSSITVLTAQGEEDPMHKKIRRRVRRRKRMIAGGIAGGVAGAVLVGPGMIVAGAVGGVVGSRIMSKNRERVKDERLVQERERIANVAKERRRMTSSVENA